MGATPTKPAPAAKAQTTVEVHKAEPVKDVFADHPNIEIKSEGRAVPPPAPGPKDPAAIPNVKVNEQAPPVGEPKTEAKKAPEVISTAGQPGEHEKEEAAKEAAAKKKEETKSTVAAKAGVGENIVHVDEEKAAKLAEGIKKDAGATTAAKVEGPIGEDESEADRVAAKLYDD